ncbi:MAG TPA: polysaccharide biosynthesis tyrosine autokinase [Bryobacteraceae bacterium]|nr:polysaccharide biosynthesis tyrosine autokinase [Bryobacteraceae bacterium]
MPALVQTQNAAGPLPPGSSWGGKRDFSGVLEYWHMVRRHQNAVIAMAIAGAIFGFCRTLSQPRIYQAHATVEIQNLNDEFLDLKSVNPTGGGGFSSDTDIQTQVRILESAKLRRRVYDRMARTPSTEPLPPTDRLSAWRRALGISPPSNDDLWKEALGSAAGGVQVRASGVTRIVDLSCDSTSPKMAADFLNALTEEYKQQNLETRWNNSQYTGDWLTTQLQEMRKKLEKAQDDLQSYVRSSGLVVTSEKNNVDETKLGDLQKELSAATADRVGKQSTWEIASAPNSADSLPAILDDANLRSTQQNLQDLRRNLAQLRVIYTPNHPEVRKVEAQIRSLEPQLAKNREDILHRLRNEYDSALRRETLLNDDYVKQAKEVSGDAAGMDHYNFLKREEDATRTLYESLLQKMKETSVAAALKANNINVVDAADVPGGPYKPDVPRSVMMGLLTGLTLGVAYAVSRERADRTLQDPGDAEHYLKIPELGIIPVGKMDEPLTTRPVEAAAAAPTAGVELITHNSRTSMVAEAFRTTLTSILFTGGVVERSRVLVVTSASPKEGKTTVVCNLSIALAEVQTRVLLIDCDMRRPRLHTVFKMENGPGLSDLLSQREPLQWSDIEHLCNPTGVPGLGLMTSGTARYKVATLLYSHKLPELLGILRQKFETVIFDTPPMVNIADARLVGRHADGMVLVVRSAYTTRDAALLAKQRLQEDGSPLLGLIMNGWNPNVPGYSYYRNYYAGYNHYYGPESPNAPPKSSKKRKKSA